LIAIKGEFRREDVKGELNSWLKRLPCGLPRAYKKDAHSSRREKNASFSCGPRLANTMRWFVVKV
jgi:hypothetical protein